MLSADARTAMQGGLPTRPLNVGVVGATGNVGTVMLEVLAQRGIAIASLRLFASERSVGKALSSGAHTALVEDLESADPAGLDVALFSAGADRSREHAMRFAAAGCVVIDNSSAFRMDEGVPLIVPEVNPKAAFTHNGIIANPNCSTIQLVCALKPIADAAGLDHVHVTTFQAVSGTGLAAIDALQRESQAALASMADSGLLGASPVRDEASPYAHPIAFNVLPHCDSFDEAGNTKEELKLTNESRKILEIADLALSATCVRVPVVNSHSEAVHLQTTRPLSVSECRGLLSAAPSVTVIDNPAANEYPLAIHASGRDDVLVGRIREDVSRQNGLALFVVADNLRKGAATNAVQILELLRGKRVSGV